MYTTPKRRGVRWGIALVTVAALAFSACGGDDDDDSSSSSDTDTTETTLAEADDAAASVEGCEDGWVDPSDMSADRPLARCDADSPAPQPLAERTTFKLSASTFNAEFASPIMLGIAKGEFEKENLDVQLNPLPLADALQLLGTGEIDGMWSSPTAGFVNAVAGDFGLKWVTGNFFPAEDSETGVWMRKVDDDPTIADLANVTFGSWGGEGSPTPSYPLAAALAEEGLTPADLNYQTLAAADVVTALRNGAIDAAWLVDPVWAQFVDDPDFVFLAGPPPGETLGGLLYGPTMLEENTEAGQAFVRALVRTINTYFAGDYKADEELVNELAAEMGLDAAMILSVPSLVFDWEIREGTTDRVQEQYLAQNLLSVTTAIPEDELVDRSFYETAVGHGS